MSDTLAAVVIHHRRFPEVLQTVRSVLDSGVVPASVLVVDNSEDDGIAEALRDAAEGWRVHTMANRGYGAAVNAAVPLLPDADHVLVVTHEVRLDARSLQLMCQAVDATPTVAVAGPGLLLTEDGDVWSRGGVLTRHLRLPRQLVDDTGTSTGIHDVDWLDGACAVYRKSVLAEHPFREDFFLYFEETELHARLRSLGWRVVTVGGASATQSSEGMPPFWGCRNVVLFQRAQGTAWSRRIAPLYFTIRTMAISVVTGHWADVRAAPRGLLAGLRATSKASGG